jgi:hypothetical protein
MRAARIAFAGYMFLLAAVAGTSGVLSMVDNSDEYGRDVLVLIGAALLLSGLLFAAAGLVLLLRRAADLTRYATLILAGICVLDAVLLTFVTVPGAPIAGLASLAAVLRWS